MKEQRTWLFNEPSESLKCKHFLCKAPRPLLFPTRRPLFLPLLLFSLLSTPLLDVRWLVCTEGWNFFFQILEALEIFSLIDFPRTGPSIPQWHWIGTHCKHWLRNKRKSKKIEIHTDSLPGYSLCVPLTMLCRREIVLSVTVLDSWPQHNLELAFSCRWWELKNSACRHDCYSPMNQNIQGEEQHIKPATEIYHCTFI